MNSQPPSFEPRSRRRRPRSEGAHVVGDGKAKARTPRVNPPDDAPKRTSGAYVAPQAEPETPRDYAPRSRPTPASPTQQAARESIPRSYAPRSATPAVQHSSAPRTPDHGTRNPTAPPTRRRRHWGRRVAAVLVVLLVCAIAWPFYLISYGNSKLAHLDALSGAANTPGTTYLIVGSDKRTAEQAAEQDVEGERSDTIMVLQVPETGSPALVSIPRDSWVTIPGYGESKINAAYSYGGPELLVSTIENLTGMTVDHYVEVSMEGVKELTDAVGGVNLCLDYDVDDQLSGLQWQAGCHDVDGTQALAFSRMRYSDPRGDIGRTERQRQVVSAILRKALTPSTMLNPFRQRSLVGAVASNLTTDTDTSIVDLAKAGLGMRSVMGENGLMGIPPITTIDYEVNGQSAVELDPDAIDQFFTKMMNGELTAADFGSIG